MSGGTERLDVALNRLCLTRSRSEAKNACESGAILVDGRPARPSDLVRAEQVITLRFRQRLVDIRLLAVPERAISKKAAKEMYQVLRDDRLDDT